MEMSENDETISGSDLAIMKTSRLEWNKNISKFPVHYKDGSSFVFRRAPESFNTSTESSFLMLDFLLNGRNGNFYNK